MNRLFRKIPFSIKLMLIAFIPLCFLVYIVIQLFNEKNENINLIKNRIDRINQSAAITALIDNLQEERKYSFDYAMTNAPRKGLVLQRPKTDRFINILKESKDPALYRFTEYTSLDRLEEVRSRIDTANMKQDAVMHYYSNMIFRLNTLNITPVPFSGYMQPIFKDVAAQRLLSEMITYLGIIRSNIYNVLYTRKYMIETIIGTVGTHDVYNSYEKEFLLKASPPFLESYKKIRSSSALMPTIGYIDTLFKRFSFDSSYTPQSWWAVSNEGVNSLRNLQQDIWQNVNNRMNEVYASETAAKRNTILMLAVIFLIVIAFVLYTIRSISHTLQELRNAAQQISKGVTNLKIEVPSDDVIGDLAKCISEIEENNNKLAYTAAAIGKGHFDVTITPRSPGDILGNSIAQMQEELMHYREKMESLVQLRTEELLRSNADLQQFAHVASHDLKEPLRKIKSFGSRLMEEHETVSEKGKVYLNKIQDASERMSKMIEGVLSYSIVSANQEAFEPVALEGIIEGIKNDLEIVIAQKNATIKYTPLPDITGIPVLIHQLFY
ncbi:MAG TPA: nitrate- and nitrite sensing domain-containing protein, partial [Ferruginibacter sp.]|nr:nitrate- and nitrite sensing domain-containing protein [Ferruginibacter sp.]